MKHIVSIILFGLVLFLFNGCTQGAAKQESAASSVAGGAVSGSAASGSEGEQHEKLSVVSTIFPGYDFVREVAGENADIHMLLPPGAESHSFEPTPQDIITIRDCDVFIYVGGDSDSWVDRILESMDTTDMKIISMMDLVETVPEEVVEGMEEDHGHSHGAESGGIYDRPLSDWQGAWATIENALNAGELDGYITHSAEENGTDFDTQKAELQKRYRSDYPAVTVTGSGLLADGKEIPYRYAGYEAVESDHGTTVWYGFETEEAGAPRFIAFSDHGTGSAPHEDEQEEHGEEEHSEEIPHFHIRYGDDSLRALAEMEDWAPTYFASDASGQQVAEAMSGHGHSHEEEYDEHVWTSPLNAISIVRHIAQVLEEADGENAETYRANSDTYIGRLEALHASFLEVTENASRKTLVFGDRFPFRYFADTYGLDYYAAFPGCSTETQPSAQTVAFLIDEVQKENIPVVFHIEFSNERMADTICEATGAKKLLLHSCHNLTPQELENDVSYLELMTENVEALRQALS